MKKVFLFTILCLFSLPVFAQGSESSHGSFWSEYSSDEEAQALEQEKSANISTEDQWSELYNQMVYEKYGSTSSPGFLNRENIEPVRSNNGFSSN